MPDTQTRQPIQLSPAALFVLQSASACTWVITANPPTGKNKLNLGFAPHERNNYVGGQRNLAMHICKFTPILLIENLVIDLNEFMDERVIG